MGLLGLFIGPVLMALLVAIWREWLREVELTDEAEAAVAREAGDAQLQVSAREAVPKPPRQRKSTAAR